MRRRHGALAGWMLPLALSMSGCSRDLGLPDVPAPSTGGAITGRMVVEDASGARLPAQGRVELLRRSDRVQASQDGLFVLIPPQEAWQALFRVDCDEATGVCAKQKLVSSADLPLVTGVDLSLGDVVLSTNGDARGRVLLADAPGAGALNVTIYVPGSPFRTETGSDGTFKLPYLPEGTMTVAAFLAGYEPVAIPGVKIAAGTTTGLADITLVPASAAITKGSITGSAVRSDGADGQVTIKVLRGADFSPVDEQTKSTGESFVFAGLPYGFYTLSAEADGYGARVVNSILLTDPPTAQADVDVGTVTIEKDEFEAPSTGGGGGTTAGACTLAASQRGPCIVGASPPAETALPPFGVVTLRVDEPLKSVGVTFRSTGGETVQAIVEGTRTVGSVTEIDARPRQPLATGVWTVSLSTETRDMDGNPAPASSRSWIVTGLSVAPAVLGLSEIPGDSGGPLGPALATTPDGQVHLAYRDERDASGDRFMLARFHPGDFVTPFSLYSQANNLGPGPRVAYSALRGAVVGLGHDTCPTPGAGAYAVSLLDLSSDTRTPVLGDAIPCADLTAMTSDAPIVGLAAAQGSQQLGLVRLSDLARVQVATVAAGFAPASLDVANAGGATYLAGRDDAGTLHVAEVKATSLAPFTDVNAALAGDKLQAEPAVCAAGGHLLVLYVAGGTLHGLLRETAWIRTAAVEHAGAESVTCRSLGDVAVVVTKNSVPGGTRIFAQYFRYDAARADRGTWVAWTNPAQADGALNDVHPGCTPDPGFGIAPDPEAGAIVAWSESCDGTRPLELRRVR
jgi:hypothetical protein